MENKKINKRNIKEKSEFIWKFKFLSESFYSRKEKDFLIFKYQISIYHLFEDKFPTGFS